jgi:hypothetical protein
MDRQSKRTRQGTPAPRRYCGDQFLLLARCRNRRQLRNQNPSNTAGLYMAARRKIDADLSDLHSGIAGKSPISE